MSKAVILVDADNTLWDTDALFAKAQLELLGSVEAVEGLEAPVSIDQRLGWLRSYDQALAQLDHRHLRYPPAFLVRSLAMALAGAPPAQAAAAVVRGTNPTPHIENRVEAIVEQFSASLSSTPDLLPGVKEGLEHAMQLDLEAWVLTEGAVELQRTRLKAHGLDGLVCGIAEVTKNTEQFARQRRRFFPLEVYVVGDQPDRDMAPAREAGCHTVLVPSRFKPQWHEKLASFADHTVTTVNEAVQWINLDVRKVRSSTLRK